VIEWFGQGDPRADAVELGGGGSFVIVDIIPVIGPFIGDCCAVDIPRTADYSCHALESEAPRASPREDQGRLA
jgi:hypothetical protein